MVDYDPFSEEVMENPLLIYERLRTEFVQGFASLPISFKPL